MKRKLSSNKFFLSFNLCSAFRQTHKQVCCKLRKWTDVQKERNEIETCVRCLSLKLGGCRRHHRCMCVCVNGLFLLCRVSRMRDDIKCGPLRDEINVWWIHHRTCVIYTLSLLQHIIEFSERLFVIILYFLHLLHRVLPRFIYFRSFVTKSIKHAIPLFLCEWEFRRDKQRQYNL